MTGRRYQPVAPGLLSASLLFLLLPIASAARGAGGPGRLGDQGGHSKDILGQPPRDIQLQVTGGRSSGTSFIRNHHPSGERVSAVHEHSVQQWGPNDASCQTCSWVLLPTSSPAASDIGAIQKPSHRFHLWKNKSIEGQHIPTNTSWVGRGASKEALYIKSRYFPAFRRDEDSRDVMGSAFIHQNKYHPFLSSVLDSRRISQGSSGSPSTYAALLNTSISQFILHKRKDGFSKYQFLSRNNNFPEVPLSQMNLFLTKKSKTSFNDTKNNNIDIKPLHPTASERRHKKISRTRLENLPLAAKFRKKSRLVPMFVKPRSLKLKREAVFEQKKHGRQFIEYRNKTQNSATSTEPLSENHWPMDPIPRVQMSNSEFPLSRRRRKISISEVTVVESGHAALPCDLSVRDPKDSVQLILWIKEGIHMPLYSYDYRELQGGRPKETKPDTNSTLAKRTSFRTDSSPAALLVDRVTTEDAGIYRCRVDFLLTPTRNTRVNLTVIVPPSRAKIEWTVGDGGGAKGETGVPTGAGGNGNVGPFRNGDTPNLRCYNDDGWPPPNVAWYEGDELLDDSFESDAEKGISENTLELGPLGRGDLSRRLTCVATNNNKTQPATTTITITMTLGIVSVRVDEVGVLSATVRAEVRCRVWGSRPKPVVTWWLGNVMLTPTHTQTLEDGNLTVSVLHFTPQSKDDGKMLICQAINERLPDQAVQDSRLLSVNYFPEASIKLGRSLNPGRIKEGDDVYFECTVKAKPSINKATWKHNGQPLETGNGVFISNMSLVVQKVSRDHGGSYTCEATNPEGTGTSDALYLDVKYAPVCVQDQKTEHSVAKLENAEISCRVHANPPNVTFRWTFNNTAEAIDVPDGRFVVSGTESRVNYIPMNELDYGTLLCWANNSIGIQTLPCVFHIVAAGKPDPPHNCRVFDVTISSLQVTCLAGDDGGLKQSFLLQVFQVGGRDPVVEVTMPSPSFSAANLRPATAYKITVTARNEKGASKPAELKAYTIRLPETQEETSAEPARDRDRGMSIPMGVVIGGALTGIPVVLLILVVSVRACVRAKRGRQDGPTSSRNPSDTSERQGEIATISSSSYFLSNGNPAYAPPSGTTPTSNVGSMEYTQLVSAEEQVAQVTVMPQVPYVYVEEQQGQFLDVTLPPPASYNQGYQPLQQPSYTTTSEQGYQSLPTGYTTLPKGFSHANIPYDHGYFPHLYSGAAAAAPSTSRQGQQEQEEQHQQQQQQAQLQQKHQKQPSQSHKHHHQKSSEGSQKSRTASVMTRRSSQDTQPLLQGDLSYVGSLRRQKKESTHSIPSSESVELLAEKSNSSSPTNAKPPPGTPGGGKGKRESAV
ncbi:uncharacterized protein LOC143019535 isoform X2 [Oratosquilla oratoria]|uniref:uncharacterized protein LOC143019535 isoform X2 n=1 Tax=Oratosquilla oratoria TaxID=337810 RepID=UPI003F75E313